MGSEFPLMIPDGMETWVPCIQRANGDALDVNCAKSEVHHPHKGGTSNIIGCLSVSDFRLRFIETDVKKSSILYNEDYLMSCDIPVASIHKLNLTTRKKRARSSITGSEPFPDDAECIQIEVLSADFNILKFDTFPSMIPFSKKFMEKLYSFGCRRDVSQLIGIRIGAKRLYNEKSRSDDTFWVKEHLRDPPAGVRCFPNEDRRLKTNPEFGWIPNSISDDELERLAIMLDDRRVPLLSCAFEEKGYLFRSGKILKGQKTVFTDGLKKAHRKDLSSESQSSVYDPIELVKLKKHLPKVEDVATSRRRLREICQCYNPEHSNTNWLEALDYTQWLTYVSRTLTFAKEIALKLKQDSKWIVLMENRACDWSCVIASLVNILLIPKYRQRKDFESLVVREWCVPRHPFSSRQELASWPEDDRAGPLFPLFLDCVHQLWHQFPSQFDFSSDLLAVLHDTSHAGLFREFLFHARPEETSLAPSVFCWDRLLSPDALVLMENPMWGLARFMDDPVEDELLPDVDVRFMRLWREHYMRALTFLDVKQSGQAATMWRLREVLTSLTHKPETDGVERRRKSSDMLRLPSGRDFSDVSAFFPLSHEASVVNTRCISSYPARPHSVHPSLLQ